MTSTLTLADNRDRMILVILLLVIGECGSAAIHPNVADHRSAVYQQLMAVPDDIADELGQHVGRNEGPHLLARSVVEAMNAIDDRVVSGVVRMDHSVVPADQHKLGTVLVVGEISLISVLPTRLQVRRVERWHALVHHSQVAQVRRRGRSHQDRRGMKDIRENIGPRLVKGRLGTGPIVRILKKNVLALNEPDHVGSAVVLDHVRVTRPEPERGAEVSIHPT